ncbi:hypothetical protein BC739_003109 [Kutzneria viridogrisea]|uniref:Uncharacterized protein n=1 Tax=Kutzneria viridogrisea TaxID=47990 RepID=A0ABR6BGA9_9PSEU|nr:hypothetical protein [Kutzneria viridogrisea]
MSISDVVSTDDCWHEEDTVHCGCGFWAFTDPDPRRRFASWMRHRDHDHHL